MVHPHFFIDIFQVTVGLQLAYQTYVSLKSQFSASRPLAAAGTHVKERATPINRRSDIAVAITSKP